MRCRPFFRRLPWVWPLLVLLLLRISPVLRAAPPTRYPLADTGQPVALLLAGPATYLVTESQVLERVGRQFVGRYQSAVPIRCALLVADSVLWLGTGRGAVRLSVRGFRARPVALPGAAARAPIVGLCRDAAGAVWMGALGYGVFRQAPDGAGSAGSDASSGGWESALTVPTVSAVIATADSSVWVGSSLGLHRLRGQQWTRYNEEGVAGFEIPDNYVDKLLPDNAGNLWVLMSAGISVFPGGGAAGAGRATPTELPTATFIGRAGNEVFGTVLLPGLGRVFATGLGLLLLPEAPAGPFASFEPAPTDVVAPKRVLRPLAVPAGPSAVGPVQLLQVDQQQRVWLVRAGEVQVLSQKEFRRLAGA